MDETPPRLSCPPDAHYAVRRERAWKRDVWRIAFAQPRRTTPKRCARGLGQRSPTPIIKDAAKAIAAPPAAATFSCLSVSTAPHRPGRWPALSSATCESTTICRFATSAPRAKNRRRALFATCSTKPSTLSDRSRRMSRSAATLRTGWTSFARCQGSISRVRSTAAHTTGPSGAGIANAHARPPSRPPRMRLSRSRAGPDPQRPRRADPSRAALGQRPSALAPTHHVLLADPRANVRRPDPRSRANGLSRATAPIAPKGPNTYR